MRQTHQNPSLCTPLLPRLREAPCVSHAHPGGCCRRHTALQRQVTVGAVLVHQALGIPPVTVLKTTH